MKTRTDFPTAVQSILHVLEGRNPYTLNKLAYETGLNFRTVKKAIDLLKASQTTFFDNSLEVSSMDNVTVIRLKEKSGLAFYPENIQHLIIRTSYYPTTTREEETLVYLLLQNAISDKTAINIEQDGIVGGLIEAEHIAKTNDGMYYLTKDGIVIAKGAIKLYPELKNASLKNHNHLIQNISITMQGLSILTAPLLPIVKSKITKRT